MSSFYSDDEDEGDEFGHDLIDAESAADSDLKRRAPRLYGKLLEASAAIQDSGGMTAFFYLVVLILAYCGLWNDWHAQVPQLQNVELDGFWPYVLVFVVVFGVWMTHSGMIEKAHYREHRDEILRLAEAAGIDRYELLSLMEGDPGISQAAGHLKADRGMM